MQTHSSSSETSTLESPSPKTSLPDSHRPRWRTVCSRFSVPLMKEYALGRLYFQLHTRHHWLRWNALWDTTQSPHKLWLMSDACFRKWAEQVHFQEALRVFTRWRTLDWNCTWAGIDKVSQEHKNGRTEKSTYWETAFVFPFVVQWHLWERVIIKDNNEIHAAVSSPVGQKMYLIHTFL